MEVRDDSIEFAEGGGFFKKLNRVLREDPVCVVLSDLSEGVGTDLTPEVLLQSVSSLRLALAAVPLVLVLNAPVLFDNDGILIDLELNASTAFETCQPTSFCSASLQARTVISGLIFRTIL